MNDEFTIKEASAVFGIVFTFLAIIGFAVGLFLSGTASYEWGKYMGKREFISYSREFHLSLCSDMLRSPDEYHVTQLEACADALTELENELNWPKR